MNLIIKASEFEIELQNSEPDYVERVLLAAFKYLEGGSFEDAYNALKTDERPNKKYKSNFVPTIDGVKEINGIKHYQCAYNCTCGKRGRRFILIGEKITTCHQCGYVLDVFPAVEDAEHDQEFNYFVAYG